MHEPIQQALIEKDVPPREHLVDAAYISAELLVHSHDEQGIILRGPTRPSPGLADAGRRAPTRRAVRGGLGAAAGALSAGQNVGEWWDGARRPAEPSHHSAICSTQDCGTCPPRPLCTHVPSHAGAHASGSHPRPQSEALHAAQAWYASEEGNGSIGNAPGVEGTLSQGVRAFGLRRTRYRGLAKTHLQHVAIAAAINIDRIVAWLDERPRARRAPPVSPPSRLCTCCIPVRQPPEVPLRSSRPLRTATPAEPHHFRLFYTT